MELDVSIGSDSVSMQIDNPHRPDYNTIYARVDELFATKSARESDLDVRGLIPRMIKGVAGCENGCPADAKSLVSRGYKDFDLEYIEGGILSAQARLSGGELVSLKLFPDF